jgi:hypothetical protein
VLDGEAALREWAGKAYQVAACGFRRERAHHSEMKSPTIPA